MVGFDNSKAGKNTIIVEYLGIKTTFDEIAVGDRIECFSLKRIEE